MSFSFDDPKTQIQSNYYAYSNQSIEDSQNKLKRFSF